MKIASVTFFPQFKNSGGAQTPAIAFYKWCKILGIECDLVGIAEGNERLSSEIRTKISPEKMHKVLNKYDFIFFQTPPWPAHVNFDLISVPYFCMINGESEEKLYGREKIERVFENKLCKGIVSLGNEFIQRKMHSNLIEWKVPACPESLTVNATEKRESEILCASRISKNKNIINFLKFANETIGMTEGAELHGYSHSNEFLGKVIKNLGAVEFYNMPFNINTLFREKRFGFFWGVSGSMDHRILMKRISLTSIEAFNMGLMPIVNPATIPKELKGAFIEYEPGFTSVDAIFSSMHLYKGNQEMWEKKSLRQINGSKYGFENSMANFNSMIEKIKEVLA